MLRRFVWNQLGRMLAICLRLRLGKSAASMADALPCAGRTACGCTWFTACCQWHRSPDMTLCMVCGWGILLRHPDGSSPLLPSAASCAASAASSASSTPLEPSPRARAACATLAASNRCSSSLPGACRSRSTSPPAATTTHLQVSTLHQCCERLSSSRRHGAAEVALPTTRHGLAGRGFAGRHLRRCSRLPAHMLRSFQSGSC